MIGPFTLGVLRAPPLWVVVASATLVGLAVGSFLNVVVYRVPRRLSVVRPPSFCPRCKTPVRPQDNIPVVSWLMLGGRCRACEAPISVRYPLVESGTAALFALVAVAVGAQWAVGGLCAAAATMAAAVAVELDGLPVPPALALVGGGITLALLGAAAGLGRLWSHLAGAGAGAAVALVVAVAVMRWTPRGEGDRRLRGGGWILVPVGVVLGWSGPVGTAAGLGALGVLVLALPGARRVAPEAQPGGLAAAGIACAAATACVTAVVVAVAVGPSLGR